MLAALILKFSEIYLDQSTVLPVLHYLDSEILQPVQEKSFHIHTEN